MRSIETKTFALVVSALLAGCGGGGSSGGSSGIAATTPSLAAGDTNTTAKISFTVPSATATQGKRGTKDLSSSINGISIVIALHSSQKLLASGNGDVSASSKNCTANSDGSRTCVVTLQTPPTPTGDTDDVTLTAYDTAPVNGTIPTSAKQLAVADAVAQTIAASSAYPISFTLDGTPASITFASPRVAFPGDQGKRSLTDAMSVRDAAGNVIVGPYSSPVALTVTDAGAHTLVSVGSAIGSATASVMNSSDASGFAVYYDGQAAAGYTAAISSAALTGSLKVATLNLSPATYLSLGSAPIVQFTGLNESTGFYVSEGGFSGTYTQTNTCGTGFTIGPASSTNGGFSIQVGATAPPACSITFGDGVFSYVPVAVAVGPATIVTIPSPHQTATPTLTINPSSMNFNGIDTIVNGGFGGAQTQTAVISEPNYSGLFAVDNTSCNSADGKTTVAYLGTNSGNRGTSFTVQANAVGSCTATFRDATGLAATLPITVTTTTIGGS